MADRDASQRDSHMKTGTGHDLDDIIRDNTPRLRSFVRARVGNRHDTDDIVQDTLYQFLRTVNIIDNPIGHVTSWLYTVAHNLVINHGKKQREVEMPQERHGEDDAFMAELSEIMAAADDDNPEMLMLRSMVWQELDNAMAELPEEQRKAVEMTEIHGLSVKDAARQMGVPVGTFLSRKHYAVGHIRKRLRNLYNELISH